MPDSKEILRQANALVRKSGGHNPFAAAKLRGIDVQTTDEFSSLLGMYVFRWKHRAIFLNARMSGQLRRTVCAHELGHDVFHRAQARRAELCELSLFRAKTSMEYEANAFAAHFLIDTEECMEAAERGLAPCQMASLFETEEELVLIKLQELMNLGYPLRLPREPKAAFLRQTARKKAP